MPFVSNAHTLMSIREETVAQVTIGPGSDALWRVLQLVRRGCHGRARVQRGKVTLRLLVTIYLNLRSIVLIERICASHLRTID